MAEKSEVNIRVVKRFGTVTGKEMFKVKDDPNGWCNSPKEAVDQYHRCKTYWDNYHSKEQKRENNHSKKRQ